MSINNKATKFTWFQLSLLHKNCIIYYIHNLKKKTYLYLGWFGWRKYPDTRPKSPNDWIKTNQSNPRIRPDREKQASLVGFSFQQLL